MATPTDVILRVTAQRITTGETHMAFAHKVTLCAASTAPQAIIAEGTTISVTADQPLDLSGAQSIDPDGTSAANST